MPARWKADSMRALGYVAEMLPDTEEYVVLWNIENMLQEGYSAAQIVLNHNHPDGVVNGCKAGVNSKGVPYDSCRYKRQVLALLHS